MILKQTSNPYPAVHAALVIVIAFLLQGVAALAQGRLPSADQQRLQEHADLQGSP